jgi:hypothetical protein
VCTSRFVFELLFHTPFLPLFFLSPTQYPFICDATLLRFEVVVNLACEEKYMRVSALASDCAGEREGETICSVTSVAEGVPFF